MARIPRSAVGNMVYHVLNRANGREKIFKKQKDSKEIGIALNLQVKGRSKEE